MNLAIWGCLITIAVYDARDNRIPNKLLLFILFLFVIENILAGTPLTTLSKAFISGSLFFSIGLVFYFLKAMAPGDVKLLGVVGVIMDWGSLFTVSYWILLSGALIGCFYYLEMASVNPIRFKLWADKWLVYFLYGVKRDTYQQTVRQSEKLRMPFAPVVVIGLALHSYF
ncbi:prepilin peptidase [Vibrio genomosp. F6]|uniref:prepilin peptidase n=1 Tax=Vibrio genomosp. F6 TaxID=723172 RepID=UPI0010BD2870|nr:prepilin peptidase [Vibrio genomosp. F6]TKF20596.1 prepilin peptidase [Vibrio genomosp. F6]